MKIKTILVLIFTFVFSACANTTSQADTSKPFDLSSFVGKTYIIDKVDGEMYTPIDRNQKATIKFTESDGKIFASGNATCNNYSGVAITNENARFIVAPIRITRMMCVGGGTVFERDFINLLGIGSKISTTENGFELKGMVTLYFKEKK